MMCDDEQTVRRDNCLLVKTVITTVLNKILIERSVQDAVDYVKSIISDLLRNRIDTSMLVITKALSKSGADYAAKQAHVELAERMRKRDPGSAPHIGDRVPYIMIEAAKGARGYEKAEDPIYVLEKGIPIDNTYYLEHQLQLPLERIFAPILGDATRSLFSMQHDILGFEFNSLSRSRSRSSPLVFVIHQRHCTGNGFVCSFAGGDHTRVRSKPTPTNIGIMKFAQLSLKCLSCRTPLPKGRKTVCPHCEEMESEMYIRTLSDVRRKEDVFGRLWTQCQRCQQSLHQDVLCSNKDCPIFYMRKKTQKDLEDSYSTLDRFMDF
jgi:DNA polymerase delta subunit 1